MSKALKITYEFTMGTLAVAVVALLYAEYNFNLSPSQLQLIATIDLAILCIFAIDYFIRLLRSTNKVHFVYHNILDLIAIIPFDMTFRAARIARLARLSKLFRFVRLGSLFASKLIVPLSILRTNSLDKVLKFTGNTILLSSIGIYFFEESMSNFGDALWWTIVTATTVGYGDISPESLGGRIIAVVLMLAGIGTIGMITGAIATYFLGSKERPAEENFNYTLRNLTDEEYKELSAVLQAKRKSNNEYIP
ncbi:MAG: potassium channel family protein [Bacillota bacterium]|nr:potassium channel family protein [Bacillota bacterium]